MGKKRKASSRSYNESNGPNLDVGDSRKRIRDFEDVADSDDEFHINRDKVLLDEEPDAKRRRKWQEQEEFIQPSDEEVLGYSGSEDEDAQNGEQRYEEDIASGSDRSDEDGGDEDDQDFRWGTTRDDMYGADDIETEEQALEEEAEGLRLQKKQLESMSAADYGFDEDEWQDVGENKQDIKEDHDDVVKEVLPQLQIREDLGPADKLKLLKSRYPEFEPLSKEIMDLMELCPSLVAATQTKDHTASPDELPNAFTKLRAGSAYLGVLAMYFVLLTSPASEEKSQAMSMAMSAAKLRDHPVMESLVKCREVWASAKDLPDDPPPYQQRDPAESTTSNGILPELGDVSQKLNVHQQPPKKSRAQRHAEAANAAAEARKAERLQRTETDLADLDALITSQPRRSSSKANRRAAADGIGSDVGEDAPLTAQEAAEKAKRKKSLRFYTSQIAQKANKRGAAGRNAGGDDDIPYRERLKDRQARLNAEAEKRGRRNEDTAAELGGESDEEDARQAKDLRASNDDDYYDLVAARTANKKAEKAAFAEARKQAAEQGGRVVQEDSVGPDGKRKITYAIEKNKGLTPHRKKEVRNPRVKKRKKFDEKTKKLKSIKPVYKGGEGRGGYRGELTGIKKGLVKSTKL